jgi:hypothetical protein
MKSAKEMIDKIKGVLNISLAEGDETPAPVEEPQQPAPQTGIGRDELEKYALKEEVNAKIAELSALISEIKGLMGKAPDVPASLSKEEAPVEAPVDKPAEPVAAEAPVESETDTSSASVTTDTVTVIPNPGLDELKEVAQAPAPVQAPQKLPELEKEVVHSPTAEVGSKPLKNILPNKPKNALDRTMDALWG